MEDVPMLRAFLSGAVSFLSPCILYLIPLYGVLVAGTTITKGKQLPLLKTTIVSLCYLAGFALIFVFTAVSSALLIGDVFFASLEYLRMAGAVATIVYGVFLVSLWKKDFSNQGKIAAGAVYCSAFLIGMGFSAGWTPCNNPTLGPLLIAASTPGTILRGGFLLTIYSFGLSTPFSLFGVGIASAITYLSKRDIFMILMRIMCGALLILFGILLVMDNLRQLTPLIPDFRLSY